MPFYRINGMTVHVRGSKRLPPPCSAAVGLLTSDGSPMSICGAPSRYQCDGPKPASKGGFGGYRRSCDQHLCHKHASVVGTDRHFCPDCNQAHLDDQRQPGLFTDLVKA